MQVTFLKKKTENVNKHVFYHNHTIAKNCRTCQITCKKKYYLTKTAKTIKVKILNHRYMHNFSKFLVVCVSSL